MPTGRLLLSEPFLTARPLELNISEAITRLVFQLAIVLLCAKIAGEICERFFKIPQVLGELTASIILGPHLLGGTH